MNSTSLPILGFLAVDLILNNLLSIQDLVDVSHVEARVPLPHQSSELAGEMFSCGKLIEVVSLGFSWESREGLRDRNTMGVPQDTLTSVGCGGKLLQYTVNEDEYGSEREPAEDSECDGSPSNPGGERMPPGPVDSYGGDVPEGQNVLEDSPRNALRKYRPPSPTSEEQWALRKKDWKKKFRDWRERPWKGMP